MTFEDMKKIVVDTLNCEEEKVTMEASLTEDLEADSLDAVDDIDQISVKNAISDFNRKKVRCRDDIYQQYQRKAEDRKKEPLRCNFLKRHIFHSYCPPAMVDMMVD